jgi:uncharacterized protein YcbK (DUF882 family)
MLALTASSGDIGSNWQTARRISVKRMNINRRHALALMSSFIATPAIALPGITLSIRNVMGESLTLRYHGYLSSAEHAAFNNLARDRRQNISSTMDGALFDVLQGIVKESGQGGTFTLLSGFRTRATNAILPGAAENSYHLGGQALDISREGMTVGEIGTILTQHSGGLGLYGNNGFVHIDTGPVRRWGEANVRPIRSVSKFTPDMLQNAFEF